MLTTLLRPTAGTATVAGADLLADPVEVRRRIGYVAQAIGATAAAPTRTPRWARRSPCRPSFTGCRRREIAERTSRLARQLDLGGLDDRLVKTLSGGQRRRLEIALGLVHSPRLVFLDEPTTGLDPQSRSNLWDHIRKLREDLGTTIFLTTHYLDEADALCDRILVIDHGKIVAEGSPDELKRRISGDSITLSVNGGPDAAKGVLGKHDGVRGVTVSGQSLRLTVDHGEEALPGMLRELDAAGLTLQSIQLARPTLDDVFLTLTGRSLREDAPELARPGPRPGGLRSAARDLPNNSRPRSADMSFAPRHHADLPAADQAVAAQPGLGHHRPDPADPLPRVLRAAAVQGGRGGRGRLPPGNSYSFFVPGLLIQLGLFGAAFVGFTIIADWRYGVIERLRVTPVSRLAILAGRVLRDVVTLLVQGIVLVLAGVAFGMRAPLGGDAGQPRVHRGSWRSACPPCPTPSAC